jgi:hypothetical protein
MVVAVAAAAAAADVAVDVVKAERMQVTARIEKETFLIFAFKILLKCNL